MGAEQTDQSDSEGATAPKEEEQKFDVKAAFDPKDMSKIGDTIIDWNKNGEKEYYTLEKCRFRKKVKKVRNYEVDPLYRKRKGINSIFKTWKKITPGEDQGEDYSDDSSDRRRLMNRLTCAE